MHVRWYWCVHGRRLTQSPREKLSRHTAHRGASASSLGVFVFFSAQARVTTPRRAIASAERPFYATETLSSVRSRS